MANCSICGESSGLVSAHPSCKTAMEAGQTRDQIIANINEARVREGQSKLDASAKVLPGLTIALFPILGAAGALSALEVLQAKDGLYVIFCLALGGMGGIFIAAIIHNFFKMTAALALKIGAYIDTRR